MHEIAETGPSALAHLVLPTARFAEVGDGRELGVDWPAREPSVVERGCGFLRVTLVSEFDVNIAWK